MARLRLSQTARRDLLHIWRDLAGRNMSAADRLLDRISQAYLRLKVYPELGRRRPDIDEHARALVADQWLVLYKLSDTGIEIVRIVHGASDLGRLDPRIWRV